MPTTQPTVFYSNTFQGARPMNTTARKQIDHENIQVVDHGIEHEQYFHGCGTSFTGYEHVVTGIGNDAREAIEDCLEQMAMACFNVDNLDEDQIIADENISDDSVSSLQSESSEDHEDYDDHHYYISIRFNEVKPNEALKPYMMENGKVQSYAFTGGYPIYYITADCGVLCPDCVNKNLELLNDKNDKQWHVVAADINYEDNSLYCDNCNKQIESAYGDD